MLDCSQTNHYFVEVLLTQPRLDPWTLIDAPNIAKYGNTWKIGKLGTLMKIGLIYVVVQFCSVLKK